MGGAAGSCPPTAQSPWWLASPGYRQCVLRTESPGCQYRATACLRTTACSPLTTDGLFPAALRSSPTAAAGRASPLALACFPHACQAWVVGGCGTPHRFYLPPAMFFPPFLSLLEGICTTSTLTSPSGFPVLLPSTMVISASPSQSRSGTLAHQSTCSLGGPLP